MKGRLAGCQEAEPWLGGAPKGSEECASRHTCLRKAGIQQPLPQISRGSPIASCEMSKGYTRSLAAPAETTSGTGRSGLFVSTFLSSLA